MNHLQITRANPTNFGAVSFAGGGIQFSDFGSASTNHQLNLCQVDFIENEYKPVVYLSANRKVVMNECRFQHNTTRSLGGAAIFAFPANKDAELYIYDSEFGFNKAEKSFLGDGNLAGGAINTSIQNIIIKRSSFFNNKASGSGGAVSIGDGNLVIEDSTFSHNQGRTTAGLSILVVGGNIVTCRVSRSTFYGNVCDENLAFGVRVTDFSGTSVFEFDHNIFQKTSLSLPIGSSLGYNLSDVNEVELNHADDLSNTDAKLGPLGAYGGFSLTHLPLRGSPAVDAGGSITPSTDQRGFTRPLDGDGDGSATNDIGAVEAGVPIEVTTSADQDDGVGVGGVSLREAIDAALPGQHVVFMGGFGGFTFTPTITNYVLGVGKHVHIDASDLNEQVIINAGSIGDSYLFDLDGILSVHGVKLKDGHGAVSLKENGSFTGDRCGIHDFDRGSSISGLSPSPSVVGNKLSDSLNVDHAGPIILNRCVIAGNISVNGGGAYINNHSYNNRISFSWFDRNVADQFGGGIYSIGSLFADASTFSRNEATLFRGGAIYSFRDVRKKVIEGSTFSENRATGSGGGLWVDENACISFSTFVGNLASSGAGAYASQTGGSLFHHNLFQKNMRTDCGVVDNSAIRPFGTPWISLGYNLSDTDEPEFDSTNDLINTEAMLTPLAWHGGAVAPSHYPLQECPSIDAGADFTFLGLCRDALNQPRVADGNADGTNRVDIGAVEAAEPVVVTSHSDPSAGGTTLREALQSVNDGGRILFDDALATNEIQLSASELDVTNSVIIDATSFRNGSGELQGITLKADVSSGVMDITEPDKDVSIHGVSFCGGDGTLGGALNLDRVRFTLSQSTIYSNEATVGGGVWLSRGNALFENVTFYGNTSSSDGEALYVNSGGELVAATLRHCTIAENDSTGGTGDGILVRDSEVVIYSSLFGDQLGVNGATSLGGVFTSLGYNLTDDGFLSHSNDLVQNPAVLFPTLERWGGLCDTVIPDFGSMAVDRGPIYFKGPPCVDARGFNRIYGPRVDIGAVEIGAKNKQGDPGTDFDGNGLDETWETYYGVSHIGNPDGDDFFNLAEYENETHPLFETLGLLITDIVCGPASNEVTITWGSEPHAAYSIAYDKDLGNETWDDQVSVFIGAVTSKTTATITAPYGTNETVSFFKIDQH